MRCAWLALLILAGASMVEAQVGSRGAVEVRRANDDIPPAPGEEEPPEPPPEPTAEHEPAPEEAPVDPASAAEPAEATEPGDPEREQSTEPPSGPDPQRPEQAAPVEPSQEPVAPEEPVDEGRDARSDSTTVVLEREADPILDELKEVVGLFGRDRTTGGLIGLLLWFAFAAALASGLRRLRERFPSEGLLPNLLALAHLGVRLVVLALALAFIVRALPPRLSLVMLLAFAGLAVAIGWSLRDVMPDLVASLVIAFERRIRRGVWVSGEGFAGHVERLGLRAALLYDTHGNRVMVPNREIVRAPVTAGVGEHARELEVEVRMAGPADEVRAALRDAVLTSPWVHPDARPVVLRDPADPTRWRVRGRLLEASFGARFEGELLERAEALMRGKS